MPPLCRGFAVRNGRARDLQRYKCHACRRPFNVLIGTPLARLRHRSAWRVFAQALIDGETVRASAARAGVPKNTAPLGGIGFWPRPRPCKPNAWPGSPRLDETGMRRSYKGARGLERPPRTRGGGTKKSRRGRDPDDEVGVLVLRDRDGHTLSSALDTGEARTIDDTVGHRLDREAVLGTDGAPVYQR